MNAPERKGFVAAVAIPSLAASADRFGISEKIAEALGWRMEEPRAVQQEFSVFRYGTTFPFCDIHGKPSIDPKTGKQYERVRLWGWEGGGKYRAPFGSGIHAYLTPHPAMKWDEAAKNAKMPLLHTEGEGKAARANTCGQGWPRTIGLTGVDCLCNKGGSMAYELVPFRYDGRPSFICYDAPMTKEVAASLYRTAIRLCQRGAVVRLLSIEDTPTYKAAFAGSKMGLDDFINAGGTWKELQSTAEDFSAKEEGQLGINPLMTSLAMIKGESGLLYVHTEGEMAGIVRKGSAMSEYYSNVSVSYLNKKSEVVTTPAFSAWMGNKYRMELSKVVVRPDLPPLSITPDGNWNSWRGMATQPKRNKRLARKFYKFLVLVFSEVSKRNPEFRVVSADGRRHLREFLLWTAHLMQYPAERRTASFNLVGLEGIGKSVLLELPAFVIGGDGAKVLDADALETQWTSWADGTIYACINEPANKSKAVANKMKALRTNPKLQINNKYGACYEVENLLTLGLSSNEFFTTAISEQARRDWVWAPEWEAKAQYRGREWGAGWCAEIGKLAAEDENFRAAVLWELLYNVNLDGYNPRADAGSSKAKLRAAASSLGDLEAEKAAAWTTLRGLVEGQNLVVFLPENWKYWMEENYITKVTKTQLQTYLSGKAQDMGWFGGGHGKKVRIKGFDKPKNVWYIAKSPLSAYGPEQRAAAFIYGPPVKGDNMEFEDAV